MNYLKDLKVPFLLGAAIFAVAFLTFGRLDFDAIVLSGLAFIFGSISNAGASYLKLTQQKESSKKLLKFLFDPPAAFVFVLGIPYAYFGEFHWILIGCALFISLILFIVAFFDWSDERTKEKLSK